MENIWLSRCFFAQGKKFVYNKENIRNRRQSDMKAVVYRDRNKVSLEERPMPTVLKSTDAIVKTTLCTICTSDLHILHGMVPAAEKGVILGHEFVGEVVQTGADVQKVKPGDRVAVNVETFCGKCFFCRHGFVNNCTDEYGGWSLGCRIDGGQAEYVRIPYADQGLNLIPEHVTDEQALFTGDLLSTGFWGARISEISEQDTVAVIGAGPAGLCAMMCAALYHPHKIAAVDIREDRLEIVRKNGLADVTLNPEKTDVVQALRNLTQGRGADRVIEAAGGKNTFEMAWKMARPNAIVTVVAMYEENQILPLVEMYGKNLTFKTGGVDAADCTEILQLIGEGKLDTGCLITHRGKLEDAEKAYEIFAGQKEGVVKYVLDCR